ncbi:hypothetical protein Gotri_001414, partial [Gossypium trilobum]|nr:hypothetical protein [Gossypium trilobum]
SWHRAVVYRALVIRPREGKSYPFPKPKHETPILLETTIVPIDYGETNLLRVINVALNQPLFFKVANHKLTVVGADASYTKPFTTSVLMLGPDQTTDVLIRGDQPPSLYYTTARAYQSAQNAPFDNTTTIAILEYKSASCAAKKCNRPTPIIPSLPAYNDTNC